MDFIQINAAQVVGETGPRNLLFENIGNDRFKYRANAMFEHIDAERLYVTDFNGDFKPDLLAFSPYTPMTLWQNDGAFSFSDVTTTLLPTHLHKTANVNTITEADFNGDGRQDFYLTRGKALYQIANNAIEHDKEQNVLHLRDEGNKSRDSMKLTTQGPLVLADFYHFPRDRSVEHIPVYLGEHKTPVKTPFDRIEISPTDATGIAKNIEKTGWYISYLSDNQWQITWFLASNVAWDIRASFTMLLMLKRHGNLNTRASTIFYYSQVSRALSMQVNAYQVIP